MPCSGEHMNATQSEIELSKVLALLEELETGILPDYHGNGYHNKAYGNSRILEPATIGLCLILQGVLDVKKYSLEMQLWWRDHQAADKKRIEEELKKKDNERDREIALSKLTPYERSLLGL